MRDPESPEGPKNPDSAAAPAALDLSIPDRRRIDSDVRAFLREPSTPWIVFDQEGRPPSQLAVGEVLKGPRRTLLSDYDFSATAAVDLASVHHKLVEPSSLSVTSDLASIERASSIAPPLPERPADIPQVAAAPMFGLSRRVLGATAAAVALLSMLLVGTLAVRSKSAPSVDSASFRNAALANAVTHAAGAAVPAEIPPPDLDRKAPALALPSQQVVAPLAQPVVAPVAAAAPSPSPSSAPASVALTVVPARNDAAAKSGPGKYGRLTITGDARSKDVFMDGKRMLGHGTRSFSVMCGAHTVGITVRSDAHDVEIPCNGELVVGK